MQGKKKHILNLCISSINDSYIFDLNCRSSHRRCSLKKGFLRNFAKFTGKHLCQRLFFNKVAGLSPATLLKKTLTQVFSCKFCEISKNTFFTEHHRATASETGFFKKIFILCIFHIITLTHSVLFATFAEADCKQI